MGLIEDYLDTPLPANWDDLPKETRRDYIQGGTASLAEGVKPRDVVCLMEIRYELLGQEIGGLTKNNNETRRLSNIMNYMPGWERMAGSSRFKEYGTQRGYRRIVDADDVLN